MIWWYCQEVKVNHLEALPEYSTEYVRSSTKFGNIFHKDRGSEWPGEPDVSAVPHPVPLVWDISIDPVSGCH